MACKKDFKQLIKVAKRQGWRVVPTRNNHLKWISPTGAFVFSASSPEDVKALKNHLTQLRRKGFNPAA